MTVQVCSPTAWRLKHKSHEFKASLCYKEPAPLKTNNNKTVILKEALINKRWKVTED